MLKLASLVVCLVILGWAEGENSSSTHSDGRGAELGTLYGDLMADMWSEGGDVVRILLQDCSEKFIGIKGNQDFMDSFPRIIRCMKRKSLRALDRTLNSDILPVAEGVNLVRYELVDRRGQVVHDSGADIFNGSMTDEELDQKEWRHMALERMARVLRTHVIKLDIDGSGKFNRPEKAEFRHRRRHQMMTLMMFGIVSMGMVFVPMGFQFLAVLGGKALLLAKMALILSSIQGLKKVDDWNRIESNKGKVATSPLNYGFYNTYPPPYEQFEKRAYNVAGDRPELHVAPSSSHEPRASAPDDSDYERVKYKYDPEARRWKPELPKAIKRSLYGMLESAVRPVYGGSATPGPDPADLTAEYTIDLPYNNIHYPAPNSMNAS